MLLNLIVGDPGGDGHAKTDTFTISVNGSREDVKRAYEEGSKLVGFDLIEDVASDYEENYISLDYVRKLEEKGFSFEEVEGYVKQKRIRGSWNRALNAYEPDTQIEVRTLYHDSYVDIYLFIINLGDPRLEAELVEENISIPIGGYGFFV